MNRALFILLFGSIGLAGYAQLKTPEKKVITYINDHMKEAMQLLIETVNINSGTLNVEGVRVHRRMGG